MAVSIHAPTRGATAEIVKEPQGNKFQSTHPRGVRPQPRGKKSPYNVSIHAPTRGATLGVPVLLSAAPSFNPRTHEGCDINRLHSRSRTDSFNPRTHEGCDLRFLDLMITLWSFNPRTHEGCDVLTKSRLLNFLEVSIHAPTRGATFIILFIEVWLRFQSTHPRGVRPVISMRCDGSRPCFNPRTHEGCDNM